MNAKKIIVTADDFGLCESVNSGILDCCAAGAVSGVSVMPSGGAFREGMAKLSAFPDIGIGVHLCLNDETPASRPEDIPSLIGADGKFPSRRETFFRLLAGKLAPAEVYREWRAQIEAVLSLGFRPDQLDSHNHVHLFPGLFRIAEHLAEEFGIDALRFPTAPAAFAGGFGPVPAAKFLLAALLSGKKEELGLRKIRTADRVFGAGGLTLERLRSFAAAAPAGKVSEIIAHPGRDKPGAYEKYSGWRADWEGERNALLEFARAGGWEKCGAGLFSRRALPGGAGLRGEKIKDLSVVIPAFNERENIAKTLGITRRHLEENGENCEIIVVDDNSSDGTGAEAERLLAGFPGKVIRTRERRGYGFALRTGFDAASKRLTAYFDGDYPAHISNLDAAYAASGKYDMVIGRRVNSLSEGPVRFVYRHVYGTLIRLALGVKASDINFAFKLFRTADWKVLGVEADGGFIDAELLFKAGRAGLSVREIPMRLLGRTFGESRLANFANIKEIIRELLRCLLKTPEFLALKSYKKAGFFALFHAVLRFLLCPVGKIEKKLPRSGRILDFGCGIGLLSQLAALHSAERTVFGSDIDERKIKIARRACGGERRLNFSTASRLGEKEHYDAVVASDVLYLLPPEERERAVSAFFEILKPGGRLIIKETDTRPVWKAAVNLVEETLAVKLLGLTSGGGIFVRGRGYYEKMLSEKGFELSVSRLDAGYPHPHILYEALKPFPPAGA
ncbi:MAG: hypothetical protein COT17_04140 [Elusimicrobia bacterium CG08_land_8_20_14_0_20_51_18]|nr:MAG: hypothetical protein COT17_04140 [Elusimicrobia bacterium CG08_land_8_20_14_0_20_51_18]